MQNIPTVQAFPQPDFRKDLVLSVLKQAAMNELLTCNLYLEIKKTSQDTDLVNLMHSASQEDWRHFKILMQCIDHLDEARPLSGSERIKTPVLSEQCSEPLLQRIEKAELAAINFQHTLCAMTIGHDYKIFDHAYALLNENMQHNRLVNECLSNGM